MAILAVPLACALALASACGGTDSPSKAPGQPDAGGSLGAAAGTVGGASPAGAASDDTAARRAAEVARAVATAQATAATQARASGVDPCRVITKEELEAALGIALNPGQGRAGECAYKAPSDANPGTMPSVTVSVLRSRTARVTYDTLRESAPPRAADVPGLGDKAYVDIGGSMPDNREIQALKGDVLVSVNLTAILNPPVGMGEDEKRAKLIALARTALGRL